MLPRKDTVPLTWPEKLKNLPRLLDRFRAASVFFDLKYPTYLIASIDARKWTSWASLSALASILEVAEYEFADLGLLDKWKHSVGLREIRNDKRFAVLKELRNYEVHIEFQKRLSHMDIDKKRVKEIVDHDSFFFTAIDWVEFQKLNNVKNGRSIVDQNAILDFNKYAETYSVETIVNYILEWLADKIYVFIQTNGGILSP
jgi:hypothetical protein